MPLAEFADVRRRNRLGQRASGTHVRYQHRLFGVEQLRRLRHEVHACEHDDVGIRFRGTPRQGERIPGYVGDTMKYLRRHVVVREHDCIALFFQGVDCSHVRRMHGPFDVGNDVLDVLVIVGGRGGDLRRVIRIGKHESPAFRAPLVCIWGQTIYAPSEHICIYSRRAYSVSSGTPAAPDTYPKIDP